MGKRSDMSIRRVKVAGVALALALCGLVAGGAPAASATPILMPTLAKELQTQWAIWDQHVFAPVGALQPPAPPCPENGMLPAPFSNCGLPEFPATTLPYPGNMAYWGGHVQVKPRLYLVLWGWGEPGAFPAGQTCASETIVEGTKKATLKCDPDGAGKRMADFVYQLGGTQWAGEQTQYYETQSGKTLHVQNQTNQLA